MGHHSRKDIKKMGEQGYKMLLEKASKVREWCDNHEYREKFRKVISKQISEEKLFASLPKTYGDVKEVHIGTIINSMFPPEKPDISKQHERLSKAYYLLTILHDKIYEYDDLVIPISVDIWSLDAEWIETLWEQMKKSSIAIADGDAVFFDKIDYALQLVEKDLTKKPAGTGQEASDNAGDTTGTGQETKTDEEPYSNYSSSPAITRYERFIKQSKNGVEAEGSVLRMPVRSSKDNWGTIESEYDVSKKAFGKKINFVSDPFKRKIIFRDVEHAFVLASEGFSKPAVILAGGVIEELLRLYLKHKKIKLKGERFVDYIKACEDKGLLKRAVHRLTDSIRDFRNLVHLGSEKTKRDTISKTIAKGAVASIFTIANDFQKVS